MAKKKYYAVRVGKTPGVYLTWEACKEQVDGYTGALHKSFSSMEEAQEYVNGGTELPASATGGWPGGDSSQREGGSPDKGCSPVESVSPGRGEAVAYVDGSYNAETRDYSCGVVLLLGNEEIRIAQKGENPDLASMRNVAGEILGAEAAMKKALELGIKKLSIYHDYQGIASWCLGEWKTNREGTKAYKEYYESIRNEIEIQFVKVKGHSGDKYNDLADELAKSVIFEQ